MTRLEKANRLYMGQLLYYYHMDWLHSKIPVLPWVMDNIADEDCYDVVCFDIACDWKKSMRIKEPSKFYHMLAIELTRIHTLFIAPGRTYAPDSEMGEIIARRQAVQDELVSFRRNLK